MFIVSAYSASLDFVCFASHSRARGHLRFLHLLTVVTNAPVGACRISTYADLFLESFLSFVWVSAPRSGIVGSNSNSVSVFSSNHHAVFHSNFTILHFQNNAQGFQFLPINTFFCVCVCLVSITAIQVGVKWFHVVVLIGVSDRDFECLFVCLFSYL